MKQKYVIVKRDDAREVWIREYTELEKDEFAFICEERYRMDDLEVVTKEDLQSVANCLRRPNMYPKMEYAEIIAQAVISHISPENEAITTEVVFDDVEVFKSKENVVDERLR